MDIQLYDGASSPVRNHGDLPPEVLWLMNQISPNTRKNYLSTIKLFIKAMSIENPAQLYSIKPAQVILYREKLRKECLANSTICAQLAALCSLFDHLVSEQVITVNPVWSVKRPKRNSGAGLTPAISEGSVRKMLEAPNVKTVSGSRDRALLHVYFFTGCRLSEAVNLDVRDVQLGCATESTLRIRGKGGKDTVVRLAPKLAEELRRYCSQQSSSALRSAPLFRAQNSQRRLGSRQAANIFMKYAAVVGLPSNITTHSARATFITRCLAQGSRIQDVQCAVAHSDITTTIRYDRTIADPRSAPAELLSY